MGRSNRGPVLVQGFDHVLDPVRFALGQVPPPGHGQGLGQEIAHDPVRVLGQGSAHELGRVHGRTKDQTVLVQGPVQGQDHVLQGHGQDPESWPVSYIRE